MASRSASITPLPCVTEAAPRGCSLPDDTEVTKFTKLTPFTPHRPGDQVLNGLCHPQSLVLAKDLGRIPGSMFLPCCTQDSVTESPATWLTFTSQ